MGEIVPLYPHTHTHTSTPQPVPKLCTPPSAHVVHNLCILNILKVEGAGPGGFRCGKRSCKMKKRPKDAEA